MISFPFPPNINIACHIVTFPPGTITILSGLTCTFLLINISDATASLSFNIPLPWVYPCSPFLSALIDAFTMWFGVLKSGCPIPRFIIFFPCCSNFCALAKSIKALSVPSLFILGLIFFLLNHLKFLKIVIILIANK